MPFAENFRIQGTFTAPATLPASINLNLGFIPSGFKMWDLTQAGVSTSAFLQYLEWQSNWTTNQGIATYITSGGTTLNQAAVTTNGISIYDGSQGFTLGPNITGTTITQANPAVATATAHGLQTGDQVIFNNLAVMKQIGGIPFTVTVTGANTFTIPINTSGFAAAETAFTINKILVNNLYFPNTLVITGITQANPMVVTTSTNHNLKVGQQVRFRIPAVFGMQQLNVGPNNSLYGLQGVISAVTSTTFTIATVNSTSFTAFVWPVVGKVPFTPAQAIPVGSGPTPITVTPALVYNDDLLVDAVTNIQFKGITIGTSILQSTGTFVIAASDVFAYEAWRDDV
jgi:hypothetical protein